MSRMFRTINKIWNPVIGCASHECIYCWARALATTKLKHLPRYQNGFKPTLVESEFSKRFTPFDFVFVSSMGDLFGEWVPQEWINRVLLRIRQFPETKFLLQTKNPGRFHSFVIPGNCYIGATIESTGNYPVSKAPSVENRYEAMCTKRHPHKFVSIEPIMDFELEVMVQWMKDILPEIVELGYDNHDHHLIEPPLAKTQALIRELEKFTTVREKTIRRAWDER